MKNKKYSINIGIPAYNEEENLSELIKKMLNQSVINAYIKNIFVISDDSTDNTDKIALSYKNKKVILVKNKSRKGQNYCQNLIFSKSNTDIVVLLEADTLPKNKSYLLNLIKPIIEDKSIGVSQGFMIAASRHNLIQKTLAMQHEIFSKIVQEKRIFNTPIPSGRGGRAFSKSVYKKINLPLSAPDDQYIYFWCKSKNIKYFLQKNSEIFFAPPDNIRDYISQIRKNNSANIKTKKTFSNKFISENTIIKTSDKVKMALIFLVKNPIYFLCYLTLMFISKLSSNNKNFQKFWPTTISTKKIVLKQSY